MTDNEVIMAAVDLADGFSATKQGFTRDLDEHDFIHFYLNEPTLAHELQLGLDGLAAQLVRQLDALNDYRFRAEFGWCAILIWEDNDWWESSSAHGPDRTMNTILAVVESRILEKKND